MKSIKSITRWLTQNNTDSQPEWKDQSPRDERLIYLTLSVVFLALAFWFYRGSNARLLGPPFGVISGQDFRQILRASREIVDGEKIYQHAIPYAEAPNFNEFKSWAASPYPYSPIVAVLAIPLLRFDENLVLVFWTILSWVFLLGTGVIIVRGIFQKRNIFKLSAVLLFFSMFGPVHLNLNLVQLDILILFLVTLSFFFYQKKSILSGVALGFAISLKLLVAPMVAYFLWKKDLKTSLTALFTFGALTVTGFFVAGWEQLPDFIRVNYLWSVTDMLSYPFNQSVNGLGLRLFTVNPYIQPVVDFPLMVVLLRVLAVITAVLLWLKLVSRRENRNSMEGFVEYGFTLSTMLFLSPLVDDIHYVWVLLPISSLLGLIALDVANKRKLLLSLFALFCVLYLANPDLHDAIYYGWENLVYGHTLVNQEYGLLTGAYLYGLIGLELCLSVIIVLFRQPVSENMAG